MAKSNGVGSYIDKDGKIKSVTNTVSNLFNGLYGNKNTSQTAIKKRS